MVVDGAVFVGEVCNSSGGRCSGGNSVEDSVALIVECGPSRGGIIVILEGVAIESGRYSTLTVVI